MSVSAAVLRTAGGAMPVEEITLPPTGPGLVRVRLHATGVCHSDLSLATGVLRQQLPAVLGHESAGVVVEVGDGVTHVVPGDHVVLSWLPACGDCFFCASAEPALCERAVADADAVAPPVLADGTAVHRGLGTAGFATETVVLARAATAIPQDVPFEVAALLGCAVLTGVGAVLNAARVPPGASVAVVGCGGVGLSVVMGARLAGAARIVAVDPAADKLALAAELGATDAVTAGESVVKEVRRLTDGRGVDYAFEAVGRASTIRDAWSMARRGGTAVVLGVGRVDDLVSFNALELFHQARALVGCVYGFTDFRRDVRALLGHWRAGRLPLERLVTRRVGLDAVGDALAAMARGDGARTVVTFDHPKSQDLR
ncbi:MAG: zinc-binding dehydrogenase [Frankia sp.]|nr:zinc-binding dehydrogenase [Frankia sp.]